MVTKFTKKNIIQRIIRPTKYANPYQSRKQIALHLNAWSLVLPRQYASQEQRTVHALFSI